MEIKKIIIVTRPTRLKQALRRFNTKKQTEFFINSRGQSFEDYELEEDNYKTARDLLLNSIPRDLGFQEVDREFLPNFIFAPGDVVVTLGQDGLVVNVAKYLKGQPVIAVNPDPERFDGVLMPFLAGDLERAVRCLTKDTFKTRNITMGRADLNDGQSLLAFNDFFIGPKNQSSARYTIHHRERSERQISSGIVISTPAGSTGWLSSFMNMTAGINMFLGKEKAPAAPDMLKSSSKKSNNRMEPSVHMDWEERRMVFMVREPFRSKWSQTEIVAGEIDTKTELTLESHMPEDGVIFSDGMLDDFLEFNSGSTVQIRLAQDTVRLVTELL